jgi:hypothetical protein
MDPREQLAAEEQLALLEFLLAALERRREVLDVVWAAADKDQAAERLRDLLGDGADPLVVLDTQVWRMTAEAREEIGSNVAHLRQILSRE